MAPMGRILDLKSRVAVLRDSFSEVLIAIYDDGGGGGGGGRYLKLATLSKGSVLKRILF